MLQIVQGETNNLILTLTERVTISNPYFLFEFLNTQTKQSYTCIAADISDYIYRYNEFELQETTDPDLLNSQISLPTQGDYIYTVYQQSSSTNLNPANAQGLLETGKAVVSDGSVTVNSTYANEPTNIVYCQ